MSYYTPSGAAYYSKSDRQQRGAAERWRAHRGALMLDGAAAAKLDAVARFPSIYG
ncbi:hypothetical protein [Polyangium spumosum]|uniref:Uncharacterized protein n=1 Tax=Polyangium spumosum TaxID=889282 RepID=A0A6N7QBA9_9BACT|nr:hypothetical protein [Polyangium spumosum]MRG98141.1 hypothetical protein [Polyangium spumosum]